MSDMGLIVDIEARMDKLEKGFRRANDVQRRASTQMEARAQQSANRLRDTYGRAGDNIAASFKRLGPALVAGLSVGALAGLTRNIAGVVKEVASIGDAAKTAGVDIEAFQELKFVGETNRIGIDAMTDGLKELSIRADEFIITGGGPAAEAFRRLNLSASQLAEGLKKPDVLFEDIIRKMEGLDDAAQIRIADEIFGGTAAEQFSALISKGADALRATRQEARDTGAVLTRDVIEKAAELDRRYAALQTRMGNFWKSFAVGAADAAVKVATLRTDLDDLFRSYDQANGLLGAGTADALRLDSGAAGEHADTIAAIRRQYEALGDTADNTSAAMMQAAATLRALGYDDVADTLYKTAQEMRNLSGELDSGAISADQFEERMNAAAETANSALGEIEAIDRASFGNVIAAVGGLIARLGDAAAKARELRASLPNATADGGTDTPPIDSAGPSSRNGHRARTEGLAITTSPRPNLPSIDASFGSPSPSSGGGGGGRSAGGGGGGAPRLNDYQREIESIAQETAALRLEAQALAEVSGARMKQGDAIEYARTRAELLAAAQRAGQQITPQLTAQIDQLAREYVEAGAAADIAAEGIREVQENSQAGADRIAGVFESVASGALSAKEAVGQLILELIKMALQKRIMEAAGVAGGSVFGKVLGFLGGGFSEGGYTGHGGKFEPAGVVHRGEYVLSKAATSAIGVGNLDALHSAARNGYSGGGLVGAARTASALPMARSGVAAPSIEINAPVTVNASGGTPAQNDDLAKRLGKQMEETMKGVVVKELTTQLRAGNLLNRR